MVKTQTGYITINSGIIQVRAKHISGVQNELADCLSRFQMDRFKKLAPMADQTPPDIPAEFWSMISKLK
jgi:hypothetical protein